MDQKQSCANGGKWNYGINSADTFGNSSRSILIKIVSGNSTVINVSDIIDQKALSPGTQEYWGKLYGVLPIIREINAEMLAKDRYKSLQKELIA